MGQEKGISQDALLENTEIDPAAFSDPKALLTYQQVIILTNNTLRLSNEPTLGIELGKAININQFGMLGYAILSCANVRQALNLGLKYHVLIDPAFNFEVVEQGEMTSVRLTSHIPIETIYNFLCDVFIANFISLARFLTGLNILPRAININRPKPDFSDRYEQFFEGCLINWDQPRTEIVFDSSIMDAPTTLADEATAKMAESQCADILSRMGPREGIVVKVRRILLSHPGHFPPIETVASHLATSTRTLSRSLQEVSTSYQKILDEVRKEMAIEYLNTSSLPIEEIAALIGYNDPSNFRKAFKRWTGNPPSYYRAVRKSVK
ncbi:Transcriptional regulator, AraC family [Oleispira antarctica RB-8]|uniref:Transcriptional regulator, AraC family n=1 Tax=Oleispira antarctica RB-8 TaxID=698738 RepID=R4YPI4_OLEAN|nr:Transcriptional regulator, AraC family [Oleispira antarctica RB-8]